LHALKTGAAMASNNEEYEWVKSSKYLTNNLTTRRVQSLVAALRSYQTRMPTKPLMNPACRVNDSLSDYVCTMCLISQCLQGLLQTKAALPLQVDVWIIPKEPHKNRIVTNRPVFGDEDDDDDDDDDEDDSDDDDSAGGDDDDDGKDDDVLGDIAEILKNDGIEFVRSKVDIMQGPSCARTMRETLNKVIGDQRSLRVCMVIDRRKKHENQFYDVYCYKPPTHEIEAEYCIEKLMDETKNFFMSHPQNSKNSAANHRYLPISPSSSVTRREFFVTYIMHSADRINVYVWFQLFYFRFLPQHLLDVLALYFMPEQNDLKKNKIDQKYIDENFKLKITDSLFDAWNKEINAKYVK